MTSDIEGVALVPTTTANLFGASSPEEVLIIAKEMAIPLAKVIRENDMITMISNKEHVQIEGWQTLGSMLGVSAHTVWSRSLDDDAGWEARAEARTRYGEVVSSAEAMCTRNERGGQWKRADEYAVRSMAQTRAQSKALAGALRFVMTLAGASGTPVEEVPEAATPAWARPAPDLHEVVRSCADILEPTLLDPEFATRRAKTLVKRIYDDCGQDVPMVVWQTFSLLLGAMVDREVDEALEAEEPAASAPIEASDLEVEGAVVRAVDAEVDGGNAEPDADEEGIDRQVTPDTTTTTEES